MKPMGPRSENARRRSITLKVRVSLDEKAMIETHARTARRSVAAFMRERSLGMHTGQQLSRLVCADLRRTALNLHRLAACAEREQDEATGQLLAQAREEVARLLDHLVGEAG